MPSDSLRFLRRRTLLRALTLAAATPALAHAADPKRPWPSRPVRILVGFAGGSSPDMAARVLAETLARALGQPVVVDNRPGASGNLAADAVSKASDDHTLGVLINGNLTSARLLNPRLPFDPVRDFSPLSLLATAPLVLVGAASEPAGADFLRAARKGGAAWNYGSVGVGSVGHLGMELLKARVGFAATHVPYNGNPAVMTALLGGQLQAALVPPGVALPQVRAGKVRAIGLTGGRSTLAPDVPPLRSFSQMDDTALAGAPVLNLDLDELQVWVALVGPAALSPAAQQRLTSLVPTLLREADARQRLFNAGWQVQATSPQALVLRTQDETRVLGQIIRQRGITLD